MSFSKRVAQIVALEEPMTGYVGTFNKVCTNFTDGVSDLLKLLAQRKEDILKLFEEISDLAALVYDEGGDYHGDDYLSQHLDSKWKLYISEDLGFDLWETPNHFQKLQNILERILRDLKGEAKDIHNAEKREQIEKYYAARPHSKLE